jgi:putative glutamine amidotransferase
MPVRIAVPEPTSRDAAYNERSLPPYFEALQTAGAIPIRIPLGLRQDEIARLLSNVHGILLPGSRYDVDPQIYGEDPIPECAEADPGRAAIDELLLQDAFNMQKPILAICYGVQALNVWRNGMLVQDLAAELKARENHQPGRGVQRAHPVRIVPGSKLAGLAPAQELPESWVNSSHHQAVRVAGDNLIVSAISPADGVVEAVELDSSEHFVLGVQWHPERTFAVSALSHSIFAAFVHAAEEWRPKRIVESVATG